MNSALHDKFKRASIHRFLLDLKGEPTLSDWQRLGKALDWRLDLAAGLLLAVQRGAITAEHATNLISGLVVIRQIEEELDLYQGEITDLADELAAGEIDENEFEQRLEALTIAILILAFLQGRGGDENEALRLSALLALESGGTERPDLDLSDLPEEAADQLQAEIEIAQTAGAGLAADIVAGRYEENEAGLLSRLAMWATTAAGVYALGQLFKSDDARLEWRVGPTEHCKDCRNLDGQVHTAAEWRDFFNRTNKRPQGHGLECGGWRCLCGLYETDKPISGNFV